jgi:hypothetical protein
VSDQGFVDFGATTLNSGYMQWARADEGQGDEGECGEGKRGGEVGGVQA